MKPAIIDCRSGTDYQQGHHRDACHIPAADLFARMHELPSSHSPIILHGDAASLIEAEAFFQQKKYHVQQSQIFNDGTAKQLETLQLLTQGSASTTLWQPSAIVKDFLTNYLSGQASAGLRALDIACGAGRDAVYLAMAGIDVTALDYNEDAIRRCSDLAQRYQVNVDCLKKDLEKEPKPLEEFASFDVILVSRYLHRPLFPAIKAALKPGGFLLYHTFMRGAEKISQPKNPNFLLEAYELRDYFADFNILADSVEKLSDGRPLSYFIAQKPK